jgi:predicted kinase
MNNIDLLVIHGPPGAGKSTIAKSIAEQLSKHNVKHALIELDDLAHIYPRSLISIMYKNLSTIWSNYIELGEIKIIIPTYLQLGELKIVKDAAPARNCTVYEILSPLSELRNRINKREQNEEVRNRLFNYLNNYKNNKENDKFIDFKVSNHHKRIDAVAAEILQAVKWL